MLFSGFKKCLYRVQKFDSDSERRFAVVLDNNSVVLKWFKPAMGDFQIHFQAVGGFLPSPGQAVAIADRLVDDATILRFTGTPYRQPRDVYGAPLDTE